MAGGAVEVCILKDLIKDGDARFKQLCRLLLMWGGVKVGIHTSFTFHYTFEVHFSSQGRLLLQKQLFLVFVLNFLDSVRSITCLLVSFDVRVFFIYFLPLFLEK